MTDHLPMSEDDGDLADTARRLRRALNSEADLVVPGHDGLRLIKERIATEGHGGPRRLLLPLLAAAAAVLAAAGATAGIVALQHRPVAPSARTAAPTPTPTPSATTTAPAAPPPVPTTTRPRATTTTTTTTTTRAEAAVRPDAPTGPLPVYWIGSGDGPPRLYREFGDEPAGIVTTADRVEAALDRMLSGYPHDPDYTSPWRGATLAVTVDGPRITVDLGARAFGRRLTPELARTALQQLVYTATAAASGSDVKAPPRTVKVLVDGRPADPWGVGLPGPLTRDATVLPEVWVLQPVEGAHPAAGVVTVSGVGRGFEGTLGWAVTDAKGSTVAQGVTQAGATGALKPFTIQVGLPPGTYTVAVWSPSPQDGDGPKPFVDTKAFTVR